MLPHHQDTGGFFIAVLHKSDSLPWQRRPREIDPPSASHRETEPSAGCGETEPSTGCGETEPSTGCGETEPSAGCGETEPSAGCGETEPSTGCGETEPSTGCGETELSTSHRETEPSAGCGETERPSVLVADTEGGVGEEREGGVAEETEAGGGGGGVKPASSEGVKPATSEGEKAATSEGVKPATSEGEKAATSEGEKAEMETEEAASESGGGERNSDTSRPSTAILGRYISVENTHKQWSLSVLELLKSWWFISVSHAADQGTGRGRRAECTERIPTSSLLRTAQSGSRSSESQQRGSSDPWL